MKTRLLGPLGAVINRHLQLRRSLGFSPRTDEIALDQFDHYLARHFPTAETITRPMVVGYLQTRVHLSLSTRHSHIASAS